MTAEVEREGDREELARLLRGVSHDFAEPVQVVLSYAELLADRSEGSLDERSERYLDGIRTGADRIRKLLDVLAVYARLERRPPQLMTVDCSEILDEAIEVTGATVVADALPVVTADPAELGYLFMNFLDHPSKIHVSSTREGDKWRISFHYAVEPRTTGIGFAACRRIVERHGGELSIEPDNTIDFTI